MSATGSADWRRHELLRVEPATWHAALRAAPLLAITPIVADWADRGWPVIVRRRREAEAADDRVPVGVPLPPSHGKERIALSVPPAGIIARAAPPALGDAVPIADPAWRPAMRRLIDLGTACGAEPRALGSLLWQHETGLPYLHRESDLDLLWPASAAAGIPALLAGIAEIERTAPMRLDGEVILADGGGVQWRELARAIEARELEVLVKSSAGLRLERVASLAAGGWAA